MRGATCGGALCRAKRRISIHAPHAGCDRGTRGRDSPLSYFNPRTPCGVRRPVYDYLALRFRISIHAPHAGCDRLWRPCMTFRRYFNPRTPCGVRLGSQITHTVSGERFQSTHPMRGATAIVTNRRCRQIISIHAPHAGCDGGNGDDSGGRVDFNPRTPCGVRPIAAAIYSDLL